MCLAAMVLSAWLSYGMPAGKEAREAGEFRIFLAGSEIGSEKYSIVSAAESIVSTSTVDYHSPADSRKKVHMETRLEMTPAYLPRSYQLKSDVNGVAASIKGSFPPNEAQFEYVTQGVPRKAGLLTGDKFTILDTNVFHHFIFLVRLFDFSSQERVQKFEVAIPQETDSGAISIKEIGMETVSVRGKNREARHLQADSGTMKVQLWVDERRQLLKIAVPSRNLVIERSSP